MLQRAIAIAAGDMAMAGMAKKPMDMEKKPMNIKMTAMVIE